MLYYVYIMASFRRVLYVGVTSDLEKRVWQHKQDVFEDCFTARYHVHRLVYFERYSEILTAIAREKQLKHFTRAEKLRLIDAANPHWDDLASGWGRKILPPRFARRKDDTQQEFGLYSALGMGHTVSIRSGCSVLRLVSRDATNRLTSVVVTSLTKTVRELAAKPFPLIITGSRRFFSAGADIGEIVALDKAAGYQFARMGQELMRLVDEFPAAVCAAITGYCMGGGLDLALACDLRIAAPHAIFGHRGAALGLITGWGGTQRLPRLLGKGQALELFTAAEKLTATRALAIGLIDAIADDPVEEAIRRLTWTLNTEDTEGNR